MKRKFLHSALIALCGITTAGCSTTVVEDEPDHFDNKDDKTHASLTFKIMHNDYTRADGTEEEDAKISKLTLAFYKVDSNTQTFLYYVNANKNESSDDYSVELNPQYDAPNAVIAFANLRNDASADDYSETSTIEYLDSHDGSLIMSSARYFNTDLETKDYVKYTPITANHLSGEKSVQIYLDRVAAKVNVSLAEGANLAHLVGYNTDGVKREFSLELVGWDVFGTDKSSYLLKNCGTAYSNLVDLLGDNGADANSWAWNNTATHSLSWAHSVNWNKTATDFPTPGNESGNSDTNHMKLSEIQNKYGEAALFHETTRNASLFDTPNALPSVVLIGQYSLNGTPQTLYRQGNIILQPYDFYRYIKGINDTEQLLYYMNGVKPTLYDFNKVKTAIETEVLIISSATDNNVAPNVVTVQINPEKANLASNISNNDNTNTNLDDKRIEELNQILLEKIGTWEIFEEGKCFFYFPIEHAGKQFDVDGVKTGSYGLVRNHQYNITVKNISGIGHGVKNDAYVGAWPNPEFSTGVNYNVTVNKWTDVNQTVE